MFARTSPCLLPRFFVIITSIESGSHNACAGYFSIPSHTLALIHEHMHLHTHMSTHAYMQMQMHIPGAGGGDQELNFISVTTYVWHTNTCKHVLATSGADWNLLSYTQLLSRQWLKAELDTHNCDFKINCELSPKMYFNLKHGVLYTVILLNSVNV